MVNEDDQDSITLRDTDGNTILQFYRHSGRPKVYVQSPMTPSTSISDKQALELAAFLLAAYSESYREEIEADDAR